MQLGVPGLVHAVPSAETQTNGSSEAGASVKNPESLNRPNVTWYRCSY